MGRRMRVVEVPQLAWFDANTRGLRFPDDWEVNVLEMKGYRSKPASKQDILKAIRKPIGTPPLKKLAEGKREVAIIFDDMTRVTRTKEAAEVILQELRGAGIRDDHVRFVAALGAHGTMTRLDFVKKLGEEIVERYPVYNHNAFFGFEKVGTTSFGTECEVNAEVMSCDFKVGMGSVVPHPHTGFGGGGKVILPGVASINTILYNHGTLSGYTSKSAPHPSTGWSKNEDNVMRMDIEECARFAGLDFKVDSIVNGLGENSSFYGGDFLGEQRAAVRVGRAHYASASPSDADVVVLNTFAKSNEATLAISNWGDKVKEGSTVVVVANAPEGQVVHYVYGAFGKIKWDSPYCDKKKRPKRIGKIIVYTRFPIVDPFLPIVDPEDMTVVKTWKEAIQEISKVHRMPRVAVLPNADMQVPRNVP